MLEIRNITKYYRSKTGETVCALDNVSVDFPEKGMVFILGKSGSGKSTLLNVIGGLDSVDGGEFVIMGKSSRDFVGSDFDAYRNTYVGFIFQEYNVLDDFSVGANIALALELQGKKAENTVVERILTDVDLLGFAHRKPNELSGGQKQRVAIARALVKEPQIIMADEPTGALDSGTGKQIFDTLKRLSAEKLVLVVSHDREFAERYADRIIELADGRVISDVTKQELEGKDLNEGIREISGQILQIRGGYRLTTEDLALINDYLEKNPAGLLLSGDARVNGELRSAAGITEAGGTTIFSDTSGVEKPPKKTYTAGETKFIRSRLPMKNAIRMGASGLKHKKFRLVLTIFLSLIAFALFGLADTMAAYDKITAATESILDANISQASFSLGVRHSYYEGDETEPYTTYYQTAGMNDADIAMLEAETGLDFVPVFNGSTTGSSSFFFVTDMMQSDDYRSEAYAGGLYGFVCMTEAEFQRTGYTLTGRLPSAPGEIVIPEFLYRQFNTAGFINQNYNEKVDAGKLTCEPTGESSIIGKHLSCPTWFGNKYEVVGRPTEFLIVGVVDTGFDYDRYAAFLPQEEDDLPTVTGELDLGTLLLQLELADTLQYGFHTLGLVCEADLDTFSQYVEKYYVPLGNYINVGQTGLYLGTAREDNCLHYLNRMAGSEVLPSLDISWLDGTPRTTLAADEYLVHVDVLNQLLTRQSGSLVAVDERAAVLYGEDWRVDPEGMSYFELLLRAELARSGGEEQTAWNTVEAEFLPIVADAFGIPLTAETSPEVREQLCLVLESASPDRTEYYQIEELLLRIYCTEQLADGKLLENAEFLNMVRAYFGDYDAAADAAGGYTMARDAYTQYLRQAEGTNIFGDKTYHTLSTEATSVYMRLTGQSLDTVFADITLAAMIWNGNGQMTLTPVISHKDWKLVGVFDNENEYELLVSDSFVSECNAYTQTNGWTSYREEVAAHEDGIWSYAIAAMPTDRATVEKLVQLSYRDDVELQFSLQNEVMQTLGMFNEIIEVCALVFLFVGIGFAVFSGLLLMNFISISISYKKREIGILRAVGARSSDVFKIFFSESLIIAFINFALAVGAVLVAIFGFNSWMYSEGINITLLTFGIRQFLLMLVISIGVAALASFLPVWRIARKKPVDAIKDR